MDERYTYGYNLGWNEENEYINLLNGIMDAYNEQISKIDEITTSKQMVDSNVIRNHTVTEEQIREWYNKDYFENNSLIPFEKYKSGILELINQKNQSLKEEISRNSYEYFANLYYLIDIKNETRVIINQRKNELNLLLEEKNVQLSSIKLERSRIKIEYDENRNIVNSEQIREIATRYDQTFLEISKINHALKSLDDMLKLMEFTEEEYDLMMRGLNPQERQIYNKITGPSIDIPINDIPTSDVPTSDVPTNDVPTSDVPTSDVPTNDVPTNDVPTSDVPTNDIPTSDVPTSDVPTSDVPISDVPTSDVPTSDVPTNDVPTNDVPTNDAPTDNIQTALTLDQIIKKVCGDDEFNDKQSSKYAASKIKIFNKLQKDNLGLAYKIVSIPRTIIGIVPRVAMNLYGKFISKETKNTFAEIEERANNLTDVEVEVILNEYKGNVAHSKRLPKGFNNAIRPRIDKYVSTKIAQINEQVKQDIIKIDYSEKVIKVLNEKLEAETNPEMRVKLEETIDMAYSKACSCIKDLVKLEKVGNDLQCGNGLHSFEEELKALDTKMNYIGGRFSKTRVYDPKIWDKLSGYSQKIKYSLDPKEVVDAYLKSQQVYKENTKEKRSIFNLGSKVTAGKLDYRPFVERLNYGNDPFVRDLITTVLVVSSSATLANNIINNIKNQEMIENINEQITEVNSVREEQQKIIDEITQSGEIIEKGIIHDIRRTEGDIENLAERGINSKYDYSLSGSEYVAEDLAHHVDTSSLSVQNTQEILNLTSKYSNGTITYPELLRGVQALKENTTEMYVDYSKELYEVVSDYAKENPQFDYTSVLKTLEHVIKNPNDSVDMSQLMIDIYESNLNVSDFQSIDLIQNTLNSADIIPNIITLGASSVKAAHEDMTSKKESKPDPKRMAEIRSLIEDLKSMKSELTEEEKLELEQLISR